MTAPMPPNAMDLIHEAAKLATYSFIVERQYSEHQRMAWSQKFDRCLCSSCQAVRPFIEDPRYCAGLDERERVS